MGRAPAKAANASLPPNSTAVASLLDSMKDGHEYESIVGHTVSAGVDLLEEVVRAMKDISVLRKRPIIAYCGNVVRNDNGDSGVDTTDDLPFSELVASVPSEARAVDIVLSTRGGNAHQVSRFVNALRARFDEVHILLPTYAMSAGTLFTLSGDTITMTSRACLGPIDPQVPTKDGRFVPAQALLLLVERLQQQGQDALANSQPVPWSAVRIIDTLDKKELADAITASRYSETMAHQFLVKYKFRSWTHHKTSGTEVTDVEKAEAAATIADALSSHDRWKAHGHAIPREILWDEVKLRIDIPDAALERALVRMWALCNWLFDKTSLLKMIVSPDYRYVKHEIRLVRTQ